MSPTLWPGDRLYADPRPATLAALATGDIVLLRDPETPGRWLVKRIAAPPGTVGTTPVVYVLGDNPGVSRDSRAFGPVPLSAIAARVWYRYAPPERRGPIERETSAPRTLK